MRKVESRTALAGPREINHEEKCLALIPGETRNGP